MIFLIVARSTDEALAFAQLNDLAQANFIVAENIAAIDGIANLTAVFVAGWRERADAFAMVQKINMAEIHGVKILEVLPDDLLISWGFLPDPAPLTVWPSVIGES